MTKLSVNVNKIATLRNSRGENNPDVLKMAQYIESLGAHGITVHPRPDERHIKKSDVFLLKENLKVELNIEGYPDKDFIDLINQVKPAQVTLVPDPPHVLTSNAGFKLKEDLALVKSAIQQLKISGARISIFIDPYDFLSRDPLLIKDTGADRIELYTAKYAHDFLGKHKIDTTDVYFEFANKIKALDLGINAGHDLSQQNLPYLLRRIPFIDEVSIGHALICDALMDGMEKTIHSYLDCLK